MSYIIRDCSLTNTDLLKNESLFHTSNGYLGVRGNFEEGYHEGYHTIRGTYINAFHEIGKIQYGERLHGFPEIKQTMLNLIDAQGIKIFVDGEEFSLFSGEIVEFDRYLDLREGATVRTIHWRSPGGKELRFCFQRMTSFHTPELFLIHCEIEAVHFNGELRILSDLNSDVMNYSAENDPRVSAEKIKSLVTDHAYYDNQVATIAAHAKESGLKIACSLQHIVSKEADFEYRMTPKGIECEIAAKLSDNEKIMLTKYVCYTDSIRHGAEGFEKAGRDKCILASKNGVEFYLDAQREYLRRFWETSGIQLLDNESLEQGIRFNLYQLLQSAGKDKYSNICAKGLSGEGYEGHYFWDTEIYMLPFFMLTQPELARNLLSFRYTILEKARENARALGHKKGALFPWRTITGSECSAFFPAGTAQYHINSDIAYAFIQYELITEDEDFSLVEGAEVLLETARLWMDTGHFMDGRFYIEGVTGPDEYSCIVNNNYYINAMAKYHLDWAHRYYCRIVERKHGAGLMMLERIDFAEQEALAFKSASEGMYLPHDDERDINPQDDNFLEKAVWDFENTPKSNYPLLLHYHPLLLYRHQVCKQADTVLAHFLLEDYQSLGTMKNSFDYYETVTTHDSSLSHCIFSIMAARFGDLTKAYQYFEDSVRLDLDDAHHNTKDGIHTANMGGTYLGIVFGFGGLRIKESGLVLRPLLPEHWEGYSFRIAYRGRVLEILVEKAGLTLSLLSGAALELQLDSIQYGRANIMLENQWRSASRNI